MIQVHRAIICIACHCLNEYNVLTTPLFFVASRRRSKFDQSRQLSRPTYIGGNYPGRLLCCPVVETQHISSSGCPVAKHDASRFDVVDARSGSLLRSSMGSRPATKSVKLLYMGFLKCASSLRGGVDAICVQFGSRGKNFPF